MKEHPIIFSTEMVRAILEGRKTQTRRIVKPQPEQWVSQAGYSWFTPKGEISFRGDTANGPAEYSIPLRYQRGDRLWVRETWQLLMPCVVSFGPGEDDWDWESEEADAIYAEKPEIGTLCYKADDPNACKWWRPSIHMPSWASRITLEVTSVRIERLQDISEDDAKAEGVDWLFSEEDCRHVVGIIGTRPEDHGYRNYLWHGDFGQYGMGSKQSDSWPYQYSGYKDAIGSFSSLWEKINAKRGYSWDDNPWVWVISFKAIEFKVVKL